MILKLELRQEKNQKNLKFEILRDAHQQFDKLVYKCFLSRSRLEMIVSDFPIIYPQAGVLYGLILNQQSFNFQKDSRYTKAQPIGWLVKAKLLGAQEMQIGYATRKWPHSHQQQVQFKKDYFLINPLDTGVYFGVPVSTST